jgi:hypothetical protein
VVVAIGQNFTASTYRVDAAFIPPDSDGAVGPLHYVEFINGRFSVFNKSDGSKVQTMTDAAFWIQAGLTFPSGWDVTDPRIIYDSSSQRWFASQVDFDASGVINTNHFLLAVSAGPDPTGAWKAVAITPDPGRNNFADFPTMGLDGQAVYLSGDMFDANSNPVGPSLVAIPKTALLANPPSTTNLTRFGVMSYATRGDVLQPAICVDGSGQGEVLATVNGGFDASGNSLTNTSLVNFKVNNGSGSSQAKLSASSFLSVPEYTGPLDPAQPDGTFNLDDGDARFTASVYQVGGVLYAVHGSQINDLAVLRWYRIDAASQTVLESGTITDPVLDLFYPSIAANALGTVVVAFNGSSSSTFVSSFAVVGSTVNGTTSFGPRVLLKSGSTSYQNTDSTGTSRWGDYGSTCNDPADPTRFWTIQEYASGARVWSTQVTELLTGVPILNAAISGSNLQLSWTGTLFTLETSPAVSPATWTPVTQNLSTNNGVVTAQLPVSAGVGFFRLHSP